MTAGAPRSTGLRGAVVPGVVLRVGLLIAALALVGLTVAGRGLLFEIVVLLMLVAVMTAVTPSSLLPGVLVGAAVVGELAGGSGDIGLRLWATVVVLHLVHVLAALAAAIPMASRVEVAALRRTAARFAAVEVVVGAVVAAGRFLPASEPSLAALVVLVAAACALACAPVYLALRRR